MSGVGHCGCTKDADDPRDHRKVYTPQEIPSLDHSPSKELCRNPAYNQGLERASCTSNAVCALYKLSLPRGCGPPEPSRLFLWYNACALTGDAPNDVGVSIRNALKALNSKGVCSEADWPYANLPFTEPSESCYVSARATRGRWHYERLNNEDVHQLRACLHEGCPFVFGFRMYDGFVKRMCGCGCMPMPTRLELASGPGVEHAAVAVGYDDQTERLTVLNSWGEGWGHGGCFYMPYDFATDTTMCFDFWKLSFKVSSAGVGPSGGRSSGAGLGMDMATWLQHR